MDDILFADVDVISPCALGGVLNDHTIPGLTASMVCGAANNQLAEIGTGMRCAHEASPMRPTMSSAQEV